MKLNQYLWIIRLALRILDRLRKRTSGTSKPSGQAEILPTIRSAPSRKKPAAQPKPPTVVAAPESLITAELTLRQRLRGSAQLRQAIVMKEILDKPLALRRRSVR